MLTDQEILTRFKDILGSLYNPEKEELYLRIYKFIEVEERWMKAFSDLSDTLFKLNSIRFDQRGFEESDWKRFKITKSPIEGIGILSI